MNKTLTVKQQKLISLGLDPNSWLLTATQKELDSCICSEGDGQGYSTCGVPCPVHFKKMSDYEYKLAILCQRSHDENPDVFNKMFKEMVEKYEEAKKEGAREMVGKVMSLLPSSPDFYSKFMELYAEIVSPKPLLNSEKK